MGIFKVNRLGLNFGILLNMAIVSSALGQVFFEAGAQGECDQSIQNVVRLSDSLRIPLEPELLQLMTAHEQSLHQKLNRLSEAYGTNLQRANFYHNEMVFVYQTLELRERLLRVESLINELPSRLGRLRRELRESTMVRNRKRQLLQASIRERDHINSLLEGQLNPSREARLRNRLWEVLGVIDTLNRELQTIDGQVQDYELQVAQADAQLGDAQQQYPQLAAQWARDCEQADLNRAMTAAQVHDRKQEVNGILANVRNNMNFRLKNIFYVKPIAVGTRSTFNSFDEPFNLSHSNYSAISGVYWDLEASSFTVCSRVYRLPYSYREAPANQIEAIKLCSLFKVNNGRQYVAHDFKWMSHVTLFADSYVDFDLMQRALAPECFREFSSRHYFDSPCHRAVDFNTTIKYK